MVTLPDSLTNGGLATVWEAVRDRLERSGIDNRGRVRLPRIDAPNRHVLATLVGRQPAKTIDLGALEAGLVRLGIGDDLADALRALGHPVSGEPAKRRAERRSAAAARARARKVAATWPEQWAPEWVDGVIRSGHIAGLDVDAVEDLIAAVRLVLDDLMSQAGRPVSRTDLAAIVLGSSHALDDGTRLGSVTTRALRHLVGEASISDIWERAGVHTDLVSGPVLVWGLELSQDSRLHSLAAAATGLGVPIHLSQMALRRHPVSVTDGLGVLVVENPRVVEAAAQRRVGKAVVSTNGNPSGAARMLIDQLLEAGADLRYHGDFDAPGLAICHRMQQAGLRPWLMGSSDYEIALADAVADDVRLPVSSDDAGPTPWDPALQKRFNQHHLIVHEERLLDRILGLSGS